MPPSGLHSAGQLGVYRSLCTYHAHVSRPHETDEQTEAQRGWDLPVVPPGKWQSRLVCPLCSEGCSPRPSSWRGAGELWGLGWWDSLAEKEAVWFCALRPGIGWVQGKFDDILTGSSCQFCGICSSWGQQSGPSSPGTPGGWKLHRDLGRCRGCGHFPITRTWIVHLYF